ncbi:MAG: tetraacyldisaccharide 4'-kinase [Pseudomonadota bacterium]
MQAPEFWRGDAHSPWPLLLAPAAALYRLGFRLRQGFARPARAPVPVICAGAATVGGAGKTPLVLTLARRLSAQGRKVHILTRGYGGRLSGPVRVDPASHDAGAVGDEALLLAEAAPTWVARDRVAGARAAAAAGAELLLLDDGLQNPTLAKDLSFLVVDGAHGFGNGRLLPAGPLREPVAAAAARVQAVVIVGPDRAGITAMLPSRLPRLAARLIPVNGETLAGRRCVAFCGIGAPEKFWASLKQIGADIAFSRAFPDHHPYGDAELAALRAEAARRGATLVTTRKDWMRLAPDRRREVAVLEVELRFEDEAALDRLLAASLGR